MVDSVDSGGQRIIQETRVYDAIAIDKNRDRDGTRSAQVSISVCT